MRKVNPFPHDKRTHSGYEPTHLETGVAENAFEKDGCTQYCEAADKCCSHDCKRWLLWIISLSIVTGVFFVLFVVFAPLYATKTTEDQTCRLTYTDGGLITEQQMLEWAKASDWPLKHPTWKGHLKTCTCNGDAYDPTAIKDTDVVDVWLAPGDMVDLALVGIHLPSGFSSTYSTAFAMEDHVKVCLEYRYLIDLWGRDGTKQHCHTEVAEGVNPYVAYDGALYCHDSTPSPPGSPPPPPLPPALTGPGKNTGAGGRRLSGSLQE